MVISEETFRLVALEDLDGRWELHDGRLVEKPDMGAEHNDAMARLALMIGSQLDWRAYRLRINSSHVKRSSRSYYIPDVCVIPADLFRTQLGKKRRLEMYGAALPYIGEIWSSSTGDYDVDDKLPEYMARGDKEIWRLHPYDKTVTAWQRQPDGIYRQVVYRGGVVRLFALPDVTIDLDALFSFE